MLSSDSCDVPLFHSPNLCLSFLLFSFSSFLDQGFATRHRLGQPAAVRSSIERASLPRTFYGALLNRRRCRETAVFAHLGILTPWSVVALGRGTLWFCPSLCRHLACRDYRYSPRSHMYAFPDFARLNCDICSHPSLPDYALEHILTTFTPTYCGHPQTVPALCLFAMPQPFCSVSCTLPVLCSSSPFPFNPHVRSHVRYRCTKGSRAFWRSHRFR